MNQQMIGKSWLEWENDLPNDSDSAEEEFLEYRQTVKKETPQLTIDHDIKSECGGGYVQTQLMECPMCKKVFKVCHIRDHMIRRHPDTKVKTEPPSNPSMSLPSGSKEVKVKKEYIGLNNNAMVKKRSLSNSSASSPIESVKRPKKDEERSFFFQRRENPTVIFARSDSDDASENDEDTTTHSGLNYINRIIRPLAYPRYGCYTEKNAKMHTYSSASRHLNQKLNLLQTNSIVQDMSRGVNDAKVYIGNLGSDPPSTTEVEKEFSYYGKLQSVWIARRPPGFAYVEFEDGRDARDACKDLDGRTVFGRRIKVEISHGRKRESRRSRSPRRRSRSPRRRSRSPRRKSRSRSRGRRSRSRSEGRRARRSPSYGGREKSVEKRGSGSPKRRERSRSRSAGSAKSAASKSRSRSRS